MIFAGLWSSILTGIPAMASTSTAKARRHKGRLWRKVCWSVWGYVSEGENEDGREWPQTLQQTHGLSTFSVALDGSLYTGIAKDLDRRLDQHNAGTASRYTRSRLPVTLEYQEEQPNQSLALKRELAIKAMSRQKKEALIWLAE